MSKLPKQHQFIDLSDYGRPFAKKIANILKDTRVTPIQVTVGFVISGISAIYFILDGNYWLAAFFLILKSILDAADGELARIKETPSYTGRYLDSIADIILNALILFSICYITKSSAYMWVSAFLGMQLQGTLYNYYYVILRNRLNGDTTSRVFETERPTALPGEKQKHVNTLFGIYRFLYGIFDKTIYALDASAAKEKLPPKWLMSLVSTFGLGFQLLIISTLLVIGQEQAILPFFIYYTFMVPMFISIRKLILRQDISGSKKGKPSSIS